MSEPTRMRMHRYRVMRTESTKYVVGEVVLSEKYKGAKPAIQVTLQSGVGVVKLKWIGVTESSPTATAKGTS